MALATESELETDSLQYVEMHFKIILSVLQHTSAIYLTTCPGIDTRADSMFRVWPLRTLKIHETQLLTITGFFFKSNFIYNFYYYL